MRIAIRSFPTGEHDQLNAIMIFNDQNRQCHSERSEESQPDGRILSAAKNDIAESRPYMIPLSIVNYIVSYMT